MGSFFNDVDIPKLFENLAKLFEEDLNEKNLYSSLKSMQMTNLQVPMDLQMNFMKRFGTN